VQGCDPASLTLEYGWKKNGVRYCLNLEAYPMEDLIKPPVLVRSPNWLGDAIMAFPP